MKVTILSALFALVVGACDSGDKDGTTTLVKSGDLYPAVMVQDCDGNPVDFRAWLATHDASYVTFGAGWCTACQEEAPFINDELVDGLAGKSVGIAQILIEKQPGEAPTTGLCASWKSSLEARYDVLVDVSQENLAPFFGAAVDTLPLHMVVTKDATIRFYKRGAIPNDMKAIIEGWLP
jgi:thiol-disulfide isomerase/thioredoxin